MFGNHLSAGHNYTWDIVQDSEPLGLNQWFFVAVSFDYDTGKMVLYKDSTVVDSAIIAPGADREVTDATISIGSFGAGNGWMWQGTLDDVRIYNRALSLEQVLALYFEGSNVIKSTETEIGEEWLVCVTPFSSDDVGVTVCSDSITIQDETVPVVVRAFESRWISNRVEIAWTLSGIPGDIGFEIYRSADTDGQFERLLDTKVVRTGDDFRFVDGTAQPGTRYVYRVSVIEDGRPVASFETSPVGPVLKLALHQNHPNPFNPTTTIGFTLDKSGYVTLRVYDISGRLVRTLVNRQMDPGVYDEQWDGLNDRGEPVASGIYLYRLKAANRSLTRKAVFLK
jgi:hypothetical protein